MNEKLTDKQEIFIRNGLSEFERIYSDMHDIYKEYEKNKPNVMSCLKQALRNYMQINRDDRLLAKSGAEGAAIVRGFYVCLLLSKEEAERNRVQELEELCEKAKGIVSFFGEIQEAEKLFKEFLIKLAIRFGNSIELLANHEEGIHRFSKFIATMCLRKLHELPKTRLLNSTADNSDKQKILFDCIFNRTSLSKEIGEIEKWWEKDDMRLKTDRNEGLSQEWTICDLLFKSPIQTSSSLHIYNGDNRSNFFGNRPGNHFLFFPAQICSDEDCKNPDFYSKLNM